MSTKTNPGNFFEDFRMGQRIVHATPRTVTEGDVALHTALYGGRFALHCSTAFAASAGLPRAPVDDLLAFNLVFGKTVPDISLNAIANLGYAAGRFGTPLYCGDTVRTTSDVIGLKQNKDGQTGVVYVRSVGVNQREEVVVDYCRWVMVRKRDASAAAPQPVTPDLPAAVDAAELTVPAGLQIRGYDTALAGSPHLWDDYEAGERIDHIDGMTVEEADHMLATRLYQNTARVHFNQHAEKGGRFGRRIVYGGHVISLARSLSFNGLANALRVAALNGGRHVAPTFAGDTVYAWSEVLDKMPLPGRRDLGALRLRTVAAKDRPCASFPYKNPDGHYDPAVVLDLDYTVLMPRRAPGVPGRSPPCETP
jgi:2-methylfumaryl-CoA hydratase